METYRKSTLLAIVDQACAADLLGLADRRTFAAGEKILAEGQLNRTLYVIEHGGVEVAKKTADGETRLAMLDPIRQSGAVAILPKPFTATDLQTALNATLDYLEMLPFELEDIETEMLQVLIVDDSSMSRNHLRRLLEAVGIDRIHEAHDGTAAAVLINAHFFDLVITDYNMPEMNGQQLLDFIRRESGQPGVPVLMVTSESNRNRLAAVQRSGVSAICDKPFTRETLYRLLQQALQNPS